MANSKHLSPRQLLALVNLAIHAKRYKEYGGYILPQMPDYHKNVIDSLHERGLIEAAEMGDNVVNHEVYRISHEGLKAISEELGMEELEAKAKLSASGVPLISMGENNKAVLDVIRDGKEEGPNIPNGIACPDCGNELSDSFSGVQGGSWPPIVGVNCVQCGWGGNRYKMPKKKESNPKGE